MTTGYIKESHKPYKTTFQNYKFSKPYISYFLSGESILQISDKDLREIFEKTNVITTNYGFKYFIDKGFTPTLNIHSDRKVSEYIINYLINNEKTFDILTRIEAFDSNTESLKKNVDYWFHNKELNIGGNYTAYWMLKLLELYFKIPTLIFGLDLDFKENVKMYDTYTNHDIKKRTKNIIYLKGKLQECERNFKMINDKSFIYNCNINSKYNGFTKKDWRSCLIEEEI